MDKGVETDTNCLLDNVALMNGQRARVAAVGEASIGGEVSVLNVAAVCHGHAFLAVLLFGLVTLPAVHAGVDDASHAYSLTCGRDRKR